jgi:hypothetical protein
MIIKNRKKQNNKHKRHKQTIKTLQQIISFNPKKINPSQLAGLFQVLINSKGILKSNKN